MNKSIAALLLGSASASINHNYKQYIHGMVPMSHEIFEQMWEVYSSEFKTLKGDASIADRKNNFANTLESIIEHNKNPKKTFTKGLNKFSDMSHEEFMAYFKMSETYNEEQHCSATHERQEVEKNVDPADMPENWDWRQHGGVSPVKNQGQCGSCWTFSTVGALEAHELLKYGEFTPLAEQ